MYQLYIYMYAQEIHWGESFYAQRCKQLDDQWNRVSTQDLQKSGGEFFRTFAEAGLSA